MRNGESDREGLFGYGVHRWRLVYTRISRVTGAERRAGRSDEGLQWDNLD